MSIMLPTELKKKWVKALRSGEYDQGREALCSISRSGAQYCCLGVLYEVEHGENAWEMKPEYCNVNDGELCAEGNSQVYGDRYIGSSVVVQLSRNNDTGKSFDDLADWIDENL